MKCAWQALLSLVPISMRQYVDRYGRQNLQEIRLRLGVAPELRTVQGSIWMDAPVTKDDLIFCINVASRYSPWSAASSACGYITAPGGHRIGLSGEFTVVCGKVTGIGQPSSLCIRVARDFPEIANNIPTDGSILIIGPPGAGKTTLLRDLIRKISLHGTGCISVVDERSEIFPVIGNSFCFPQGSRTDVLTGCSKPQGIEFALRNMGPETIAVDEITAQEDCDALIHAGWCGVRLVATAHAANTRDLTERPVYRPIIASGLFQTLIILQTDKSWRTERMEICYSKSLEH